MPSTNDNLGVTALAVAFFPATDYNAANQMTLFDDRVMNSDNNENHTTITDTCGTTIYTWDARNRLIGIDGYT
ncbi:MAG: hypothetical protein IME98_00625, partial [Proteobacteria bacterium]|nr:hypothetical protein [Pseudomonadota bacterium]